MAKAKKVETTEKPVKEAQVKPNYGVPELAEHMGLEPTSVRVKLRNAGIEKSGRSYGWDTKKAMEQAAKDLKAAAPEKAAPAADEKPAKKPRGKKAKAE
jgi:hypothetical protein